MVSLMSTVETNLLAKEAAADTEANLCADHVLLCSSTMVMNVSPATPISHVIIT
jgi:hypothetical protein